MVRRLVLAACTSVLAATPGTSWAQTREVLLNQIDPQGTTLVLTIVPGASRLPPWLRPDNLVDVSVEAPQGGGGTGQAAPRGNIAGIKSQFSVKSTAPDNSRPQLRLGTSASSVNISGTSKALTALPTCEANSTPQPSCKISDLGKEIVQAATSHARGKSTSFKALIAARGLVIDTRSAKRVTVTLDDKNALQHVDFVGLVRSKTEKLNAPDASSAFVVRLERSGNFSIVERRQDAAVDPATIKFGEE